jgi:hypothetical protein
MAKLDTSESETLYHQWKNSTGGMAEFRVEYFNYWSDYEPL